jgi:hypothetical protein
MYSFFTGNYKCISYYCGSVSAGSAKLRRQGLAENGRNRE